MRYPKAEVMRWWPLIALLSMLAGCAFQYAQSISLGIKAKRAACDSMEVRR